jgi:DUF971 family protein
VRWTVLPLLAAAPLFAQNSAQNPAQDSVFKVSVDLVQVDAVVTDSQGHHSRAGVLGPGQLRLPDSLPAGDYAVELVVHDGGKSATQWTDFTIVK